MEGRGSNCMYKYIGMKLMFTYEVGEGLMKY